MGSGSGFGSDKKKKQFWFLFLVMDENKFIRLRWYVDNIHREKFTTIKKYMVFLYSFLKFSNLNFYYNPIT